MQNADVEIRRALMESVRRLMHPQEMGAAFKFFAIAPKGTDYVPPGFTPITAHTEPKSEQKSELKSEPKSEPKSK